MNIILIENNNLFESVKTELHLESPQSIDLDRKIEVVATKIRDQYKRADLFVINANVLIDNCTHSDCAGIKLLKFIRLRGMTQHVVLYSFLNREQLMTLSPYHSIIFSKGVSFLRLPEELKALDFEKLAIIKTDFDLSDYFRAEYRLPDDRHFMANWWGMLQLWKVQKAIERIAGEEKAQVIEQAFAGSINEMYSYQGLVAKYLNRQKERDIEDELHKLLLERKNNYKDIALERGKVDTEIKRKINELTDNERELNTLVAVNVEENSFLKKIVAKILRNETEQKVQQRIQQLMENKQSLDQEISHLSDYQYILDSIEKEKERIYEANRAANRQLLSLQQKLEKELSFTSENFSLDQIRETLKKEQPKIVYVDDQADEGWAAILQRIIYGGESDAFVKIVPEKEHTFGEIADEIITNLENAQLLILDIRLKNESGQIIPSALSGFQVLKYLRKRFIACPVLIVTASNKIWSLKEAFVNGACALWTKEGLDTPLDTRESVENYLRLIDLIYSLTRNTSLFEIISNIYKTIDKIKKADSPFWWEGKFWPDEYYDRESQKTITINKNIIDNKDTIVEILSHVIELAENKLYATFLNGQIFVPESFFPVTVSRCSLILEEIHKVKKENDKFPLSEKISAQLGQTVYSYYSELIRIRNNSVHHYGTLSITTFSKYVNLLIDYLFENFESIDPSNVSDAEDGNELSNIRKALANGEVVEVSVTSHTNNFVNFLIDENESAYIYSKTQNGQELIPYSENIQKGSILSVKPIQKGNIDSNEVLERGLIYRVKDTKKNPLLKFVKVVSY
jgi:CheY-like chemotaxis protein